MVMIDKVTTEYVDVFCDICRYKFSRIYFKDHDKDIIHVRCRHCWDNGFSNEAHLRFDNIRRFAKGSTCGTIILHDLFDN